MVPCDADLSVSRAETNCFFLGRPSTTAQTRDVSLFDFTSPFPLLDRSFSLGESTYFGVKGSTGQEYIQLGRSPRTEENSYSDKRLT
jgi:hypothetical protein